MRTCTYTCTCTHILLVVYCSMYMHSRHKHGGFIQARLPKLESVTVYNNMHNEYQFSFSPVHHPRTPYQTSMSSHIQNGEQISPHPVSSGGKRESMFNVVLSALSLSLSLSLSPSLPPYSDDDCLIWVHVVHYES